MRKYPLSSRELRKRSQDRLGVALISATVLGFGALVYGAARIDAANGITVSQSLASVGIGHAERPAVAIRLVGKCNGRIMGAMEESAFPAGCEWIEPFHAEEDVN